MTELVGVRRSMLTRIAYALHRREPHGQDPVENALLAGHEVRPFEPPRE